MRRWTLLLLVVLSLGAGCGLIDELPPEDFWMDSPLTQDAALSDPHFLVSTRPGLTAADRDRPVLVVAHGYSASTFEWWEFRDHAQTNSDALVSLVLLGGHGRNTDAFREATCADWGQPIVDEYRALVAQGYTRISLVGASAGATLMLTQLAGSTYDAVPPVDVAFVDPIVVPGVKLLKLVRAIGPALGNAPATRSDDQKKYWYVNRPWQTLDELNGLMNEARRVLKRGATLPPGTTAKVYKATGDLVADPVSAVYLYEGLRTADGSRIDVELLDTDKHVYTRLSLRGSTAADRARQEATFDELITRAGGKLAAKRGQSLTISAR